MNESTDEFLFAVSCFIELTPIRHHTVALVIAPNEQAAIDKMNKVYFPIYSPTDGWVYSYRTIQADDYILSFVK